MSFDVNAIRAQFPVLQREIDGKPLVYLDNAATTQKPQAVIDALVEYYTQYNSNVHRGAHRLADEATRAYESARDSVANFINAAHREEVIWTSGTTEAINLVANGVGQLFKAGDEIIVSELEHHANLVTWQQACKSSGAILKICPIFDTGELDIDAFDALLSDNTRLVALPHVSNALGTVNPIKEICRKAKQKSAWVLIDGAQGIAHGDVDVQDIGCDFYAFSGHKLFAPTGVGALWGRKALLESWPVWQTGGEMIADVNYQDATWGVLPNRLEAGTPNIAPNKVGVLSFELAGAHPADVGFILDKQGIAIRTGDNCAQPLMKRLGLPGTARASFSIYNTRQDVDLFFEAVKKAKAMLA